MKLEQCIMLAFPDIYFWRTLLKIPSGFGAVHVNLTMNQYDNGLITTQIVALITSHYY